MQWIGWVHELRFNSAGFWKMNYFKEDYHYYLNSYKIWLKTETLDLLNAGIHEPLCYGLEFEWPRLMEFFMYLTH